MLACCQAHSNAWPDDDGEITAYSRCPTALKGCEDHNRTKLNHRLKAIAFCCEFENFIDLFCNRAVKLICFSGTSEYVGGKEQ